MRTINDARKENEKEIEMLSKIAARSSLRHERLIEAVLLVANELQQLNVYMESIAEEIGGFRVQL